MSTPITLPVGPTWRAARKQSKPAPLPRSRTVSPGRSAAADNGVAAAQAEVSAFRDGSDVFLGIAEESGGIPRAPDVTATARDRRAVLVVVATPGNLAPLAGDRAVAFAHRSSDVLKIGKGFFEHRVLRTPTALFASRVAIARTTVARQMVEAATVARPVVEHATTGRNFKLTAFEQDVL